MKLPNFRENERLNLLRDAMGAEYVEQKPGNDKWKPLDPNELREQLRSRKGLEVDFPEDLVRGDDGTLAIKGERVLIYIRDVGSFGSRPKFHIAHCATLRGMVRNNRGDRYVVSNRTDGIFQINVNNGYAGVQLEDVPLEVCKNCLRELNWPKGYRHAYGQRASGYRYAYGQQTKRKIFEGFRLEDFFERYSETPTTWRPLLNNETAPLNAYTKDWHEISRQYRESVGWRCQDCGFDCQNQIHILHVHHIDGNKANNDPANLKVLCHWCHRKQPGHGHMARNPVSAGR